MRGIVCASSTALGAVASLAAVRLRRRYARDIARARERLADSDPCVATTPCGAIEYAVAGDGIPVLELHGSFGGFDQGLVVARSLLGDGFRIIAPSRFGYLGTPLPPDASPERQADAHVWLLDHLGVDRAAVVAHSAGSVSAIQMALRHPDRMTSLTLVSPAAPGPGPTAPPRPVVQALLRSNLPIWMLATFWPTAMPLGVPRDLTLSPADRAALSAVVNTLLPATPRRDGLLFDIFVSAPTINSGLPFGAVGVPTLVITAVDDPLAFAANARALAAEVPNARLIEVGRGGHLLLGQADRVGEGLAAFIREHAQAGLPG